MPSSALQVKEGGRWGGNKGVGGVPSYPGSFLRTDRGNEPGDEATGGVEEGTKGLEGWRSERGREEGSYSVNSFREVGWPLYPEGGSGRRREAREGS